MYEMNIRVRYSETDLKGHVRLHQILDYFQDIATFHSLDMGLMAGGDFVEGHGWYLLAWDVKVDRYPSMGESIRIITDPYLMKGFYGYRRFYMKDKDDQVIATADSVWLLMDMAKKLPVKISTELIQLFVTGESDPTVKIKRKLPVRGDWQEVGSFEITDVFLDSNHHVNNAFYVQWALMILPEEERITRLRTDYRQSTLKGDQLHIYYYKEGDTHRVKFENQEKVLIAMVDLS